jgi:hypothetical protein
MKGKCIVWLSVFAVVILLGNDGLAGNRQLMSEKAAKADMTRNLMESVIGYKVLSKFRGGLTQQAFYQIAEKAGARIKGIHVESMIYDEDKDIAFCIGYIDLGDVTTVARERISFEDVRVRAYGFGTMTEASKPPLRALRAALLNAYDEMAAKIVGQEIISKSRAENFILTKDIIKARVSAAVYGAHIPNPDIDDPDRGWGWEPSGNAFVKLRLDVRKVRDVMGQRIRYSGPNIVEVLGRGSQTDELSEPVGGTGGHGLIDDSQIYETEKRSLPVPVGDQHELKGEYESPDSEVRRQYQKEKIITPWL